MFPFNITNPGIYIEGLLTSGEAALVTNLASLSPSDGDTFIYDSGTGLWTVGPASTGSTTFTALTDTPANYTGQSTKAVRVNVGETGLEFVDFPTGAGDVTAAAAFGTDNRIIRSDGTGKGVQSSGITITDANAITGATINAPDNTITNIGTSSIIDEAITLAKMAHIATSSILGRATASTGDVEVLTGSQVRDIAGLDTDDTPQFAGINVGHATDTTIGRTAAGIINVEGNPLPRITSGAGAPATTPGQVGDIYVDTTGDDAYISVGTASSSDWEKTNDGAGGSVTLDGAYDQGGSGAGRSITADSGAVEITVPNTSNNSGLVINQNDVTNNPVALKIVTDSVVNEDAKQTTSAVVVQSNDSGTLGPYITYFANSASPAVNDNVGTFAFIGKNSLGNNHQYASFYANILDETSGSESAQFVFSADIFLSVSDRVKIGTNLTPGILESQGDQNLILQTGNATTGSITITDGANGAINIAPNGTGEAQVNGQRIIDESDTNYVKLAGVTATAAELNTLDGITATTAELNHTDGVTSNIQTQLNAKAPTASPTLTGTTTADRLDYDRAIGTVSAIGNIGASRTFDWATATHFTGDLDANTTLNFSNAVSGQKITLALAYSGALRTIGWTPTIKWAGGSAPTGPDAAGEVLLVTVAYLGTTYYGSFEIFS